MTPPYFTKTIGGPTGRPEDKSYWHYNADSGAWYGYPDDDPAPAAVDRTTGASVSSEVPPAPLTVAFSAGKAAMAAGSGPSLRRDGRIPCFHCKACDGGRYQDCGQTFSKAEARLHSQQAAADVIDQAGATMVELQRVVYAEEARRGMAF